MGQIAIKKLFFFLVRIFIFKIFYKLNFKLTSIINEEILLNFLIKLRPYKTNHELIRLGEIGDGGYIIPNDLIDVKACFSAGVGPIVGFEYDLAQKGIDCFMADYSVDKPPLLHEKFKFEKKFIGTENNEMYIKFEDWFAKYSEPSEDYILKIDIECDEYKILPLISTENLSKFRIIILEIHDFSNVITPMGFNIIKLIFDKIQKNHTIVHINPNNVSPSIKFSKKIELYDMLEITLLRNNRITQKKEEIVFPHYLDSKNNNIFKSKLPDCFYKNN